MPQLLPELHPLRLDTSSLFLDPNNPRFRTDQSDHVPVEKYDSESVITSTRKRMEYLGSGDKNYKLGEIRDSIRSKGWWPVDKIYVRKFNETPAKYIVLEGNRRVVAIKQLLDSADDHFDPDLEEHIKKQIASLQVLEVKPSINSTDEAEEKKVQEKINYLLGIRGFGSLKAWSPFAQAAVLYKDYLGLAGQTDETFAWNQGIAEKLALQCCSTASEVKERLQVYRVMRQIDELDSVQEVDGIRDRDYSITKEGAVSRHGGLDDYFVTDPSDFRLDEQSLDRMMNLYHFDRPGRSDSPMQNPQDCRSLGEILKEDDAVKKEEMLFRVEKSKERPTIVFAEREVERRTQTWAAWLSRLKTMFEKNTMGFYTAQDPDQIEALGRLGAVLDSLEDGDE
jgi:hypothetical protein